MVIILTRGLPNYRFWKMQTRRASGRQDISVHWYLIDGGGERQKEAHSADSDKQEGSNHFHFFTLGCFAPPTGILGPQSPFPVSSLPLLSQRSPCTVPLPICDWNGEKGVPSCLLVQTCLCWDPWVGFGFVYFIPLLGPPWALVTTCEELKSFRKSPRNWQTSRHNTAGRFSVQFLQRCAMWTRDWLLATMSVCGENMVQWYFEKYSFI